MRVNLNAVLKDHRDRVLSQKVSESDKTVTPILLGDILETALVGGPWPKDEPDATEKKTRFKLAVKIVKTEESESENENGPVKEIEFSAAEITSLKAVIHLAFPSPIVVSAVHHLLDPSGE